MAGNDKDSSETKGRVFNVLKLIGFILLGSSVAIPVIALAFIFVDAIFEVFLKTKLSLVTGLNTLVVYSCLFIPIAFAIILFVLFRRNYTNLLRGLLIAWPMLILLGTITVISGSVIGAPEVIIPTDTITSTVTSTPAILQTDLPPET